MKGLSNTMTACCTLLWLTKSSGKPRLGISAWTTTARCMLLHVHCKLCIIDYCSSTSTVVVVLQQALGVFHTARD